MKISFLASHGGSAAKHIISAIRENKIAAEVGLVITNNRNSDIYQWCIDNEIEVIHISGSTHPEETENDSAIRQQLRSVKTDLIILSGYMKKIGPITLDCYVNKILNIHPSLLPRHGGKGLYGDKVHESVLKSGDKQSGATVQFINAEYDEGPIIAQQKVNVIEGEIIASLKKKVQAIEGELFLNSIKQILQGPIT
ncbi:MAG: phosphoribosylglycinamide formyltransferase [Methylococcales bacterium]|nr:phosphoribosylglycinamide formyltransferase [Methylococcales bacterium]